MIKIRNRQIDVMRGIGILLMVYGHCCRANSIIALFHMPLFFILSGYCFNGDRCDSKISVLVWIKRKIQSLWLPYFLYTSVFLFGTNVFIKLGIYTNNDMILSLKNSPIDKVHYYMSIKDYIKAFVMEFLFQTETQLGGALWFLQCLFFSSCLFIILIFLLNKVCQNTWKKELVLIVVSVLFLLLGFYCSVNSIWVKGFNRAFSCFWMITFGYLIKQHNIMKYYRNWFSIVALVLLVILERYGKISIQANQYPNPVFLVVCSILGWFMIYGLSNVVCGERCFLSNILQYIGKHSIPILALHFLSFKIVTFLIICIRHYPYVYLATFPVIYDYTWVILYMILGIVLPLLADYFWIGCKLKIKEITK